VNHEQLERKIAQLPYPRVTREDIESKIESVTYFVLPGTTVTICNILMRNGFSVRGESAAVDSRNYRQDIGEEMSYMKAIDHLFELEGYLLAERRFEHSLEANQEPT
jgi:hypothetical protein